MTLKEDLSDISGDELLKLAQERIFSMGLRDLASALSYKNMLHGLGKMIYVLEGGAYCVFSPDATITRKKGRWMSGFGYGGVIRWQDENIAFPEIRPNGCGMLLMRLDSLPSEKELMERASKVNERNLKLDGTEIIPDFGRGNHFFEVYEPLEISDDISDEFPEDAYYAILHGSGPELKDEVYSWTEKGEKEDTPLGKITVLRGEDAEKYYRDWENLESFSKKRREIIAQEVVGSHGTISNITHQGLFGRNEARLGCYDTKGGNGDLLFPVALRWDCPTYVLRGRKNISEEVMHRLEFEERAEKLGLKDELGEINVLPHGGGYELELSYEEMDVRNTSFGRIYILSGMEPAPGLTDVGEGKGVSRFGKMAFIDPNSLPYSYRGKRVIGKTTELKLGEIEAKLRPMLTMKV